MAVSSTASLIFSHPNNNNRLSSQSSDIPSGSNSQSNDPALSPNSTVYDMDDNYSKTDNHVELTNSKINYNEQPTSNRFNGCFFYGGLDLMLQNSDQNTNQSYNSSLPGIQSPTTSPSSFQHSSNQFDIRTLVPLPLPVARQSKLSPEFPFSTLDHGNHAFNSFIENNDQQQPETPGTNLDYTDDPLGQLLNSFGFLSSSHFNNIESGSNLFTGMDSTPASLDGCGQLDFQQYGYTNDQHSDNTMSLLDSLQSIQQGLAASLFDYSSTNFNQNQFSSESRSASVGLGNETSPSLLDIVGAHNPYSNIEPKQEKPYRQQERNNHIRTNTDVKHGMYNTSRQSVDQSIHNEQSQFNYSPLDQRIQIGKATKIVRSTTPRHSSDTNSCLESKTPSSITIGRASPESTVDDNSSPSETGNSKQRREMQSLHRPRRVSSSVLGALLRRLRSLHNESAITDSTYSNSEKSQRKTDAIAYAVNQLSVNDLFQLLRNVISFHNGSSQDQSNKPAEWYRIQHPYKREEDSLLQYNSENETSRIFSSDNLDKITDELEIVSGIEDRQFLRGVAEWCQTQVKANSTKTQSGSVKIPFNQYSVTTIPHLTSEVDDTRSTTSESPVCQQTSNVNDTTGHSYLGSTLMRSQPISDNRTSSPKSDNGSKGINNVNTSPIGSGLPTGIRQSDQHQSTPYTWIQPQGRINSQTEHSNNGISIPAVFNAILSQIDTLQQALKAQVELQTSTLSALLTTQIELGLLKNYSGVNNEDGNNGSENIAQKSNDRRPSEKSAETTECLIEQVRDSAVDSGVKSPSFSNEENNLRQKRQRTSADDEDKEEPCRKEIKLLSDSGDDNKVFYTSDTSDSLLQHESISTDNLTTNESDNSTSDSVTQSTNTCDLHSVNDVGGCPPLHEQCLLQLEALGITTPHWASHSNSLQWHRQRLLQCHRNTQYGDVESGSHDSQIADDYFHIFLDDFGITESTSRIGTATTAIISRQAIQFISPTDVQGKRKPYWEMTQPLISGESTDGSSYQQNSAGDSQIIVRLQQAIELLPSWICRLDAYRQIYDPTFDPLTALPPHLQVTAFSQFLSTYIDESSRQLKVLKHELSKHINEIKSNDQMKPGQQTNNIGILYKKPNDNNPAIEQLCESPSLILTGYDNDSTHSSIRRPYEDPILAYPQSDSKLVNRTSTIRPLNKRRMMVMVCPAKLASSTAIVQRNDMNDISSETSMINRSGPNTMTRCVNPVEYTPKPINKGTQEKTNEKEMPRPVVKLGEATDNKQESPNIKQQTYGQQNNTTHPNPCHSPNIPCPILPPTVLGSSPNPTSDFRSTLCPNKEETANKSTTSAVNVSQIEDRNLTKRNNGVQGVLWKPEEEAWVAFWQDPVTNQQQIRRFPVGQYGPEIARKMALKCRKDADKQLTVITEQTSDPGYIALPRSDVPGVYWYRNRNGWVAQWFEHGKNKHKFFAASVFGVEGAKQKAIAYRLMKLEEKKSKGW